MEDITTEEQPTTSGPAASPGNLALGDILGAPFRDPRALQKFLGGCVAVIAIVFFGIGLLALLGYAFQTAQRARRGEEHPLPEWEDVGALLGDGLRVLAVLLGYALAGLAVTALGGILSFIPILGGIVAAGFGVMLWILYLVMALLLPVALARLVATGDIGASFRIQENLRSFQAHLGTNVFFVLIVILIKVLAGASSLFCGIGLIPGMFWGYAAFGVGLGRAARAMNI